MAGAANAQQKFSRLQLQADADTLYCRITRIHPDPFYRSEQPNFETDYRLARALLADSMAAVDFYRIMAPALNRLRDGHTGLDIRSVDTGRSRSTKCPPKRRWNLPSDGWIKNSIAF